jgi:hypothetical protein
MCLRTRQRQLRSEGLENHEIGFLLTEEETLNFRDPETRLQVELAMAGDGTQAVPARHEKHPVKALIHSDVDSVSIANASADEEFEGLPPQMFVSLDALAEIDPECLVDHDCNPEEELLELELVSAKQS